MGMIRYTVTTITKRCPYCGEKLGEETHGQFTPLYGYVLLFTFPVAIPYLLIRYLVFKNPCFPKIGEKFFQCPHCSNLIQTENYAIEDLEGENLFLHKFKKWIYFCYLLGAAFGVSIFILLLEGLPIVSWCGLTALISLVTCIIITILYYANLEETKHPKPIVHKQEKTVAELNATMLNNENMSFVYCRKCGERLPADSQFCNNCGTEIKK